MACVNFNFILLQKRLKRGFLEKMPIIWYATAISAVLFFLFLPAGSFAVTKKSVQPSKKESLHQAALVRDLPRVVIAPGETATVRLQFRNRGKSTWRNTGANYVSMYTDPSTHKSPLYSKKWKTKQQPAMLKESIVKPGGIGTFVMTLQAPEKDGEYNEKFKIALENSAWIHGSYITLPITVSSKNTLARAEFINNETSTTALQGKVMIRSDDTIEAAGGVPIEVRFGIKNTGEVPWHNVTLIEPGVMLALTHRSPFHDASWPDNRIAYAAGSNEYLPGRMGIFSLTVRAPRNVGTHLLKLKLMSNGQEVRGTEIELPITVTTPAPPELIQEPPLMQPWTGVKEPMMRVGIIDSEIADVTVNSTYRIIDGTGREFGDLLPETHAIFSFDSSTGRQILKMDARMFETDSYFRLEPSDVIGAGLFTIHSLNNNPKWNGTINDNVFRGTFEMRRNDKGYAWLINELPLDSYVKGIAEASNPWPIEFHKAQAAAARSYALYYLERGGKHTGSYHVLNSSAYDQVYRGYNAESRHPRLVEAVDATRGMVVQYEGKTAVTMYFARSGGRTKSWTETWGGVGKPYLVARDAPYDAEKGFKLWGHGVGMSQTDAALRAERESLGFADILKAYYTGVTVERVFE